MTIRREASDAQIAFRVDSSSTIGSGHLRRCLTLAAALQRRGFGCLFLSRNHPNNLNASIGAAGFDLIDLRAPDGSAAPDREYARWLGVAQATDAEETLAALAAAGVRPAAMVVDHYALDAEWERIVRPHVSRIAVIDDLANRAHEADLLIDVTPGVTESRYRDLVPSSARLLLGPAYALLRPEFRLRRRERGPRTGQIRRVIISFGAVDADNLSDASIAAVRDVLGHAVHIDVVISGIAAHLDVLRAREAADPKLAIHVDTDRVAELMQVSDLAIGAGGTTSWERACLGLPAILCAIADNQQDTLRTLTDTGCAVGVSADAASFPDAVRHVLTWLSEQPAVMRLMGEAGGRLVDGRGAERVAHAISPPRLMMRRATAEDAENIWRWRNDEPVRMSSKSSDPIAWEAHAVWFARAMADPDREILICEDATGPVGVVRFDADGDAAEVSVYLTPASHGRGIGAAILRAGEAWLREGHPRLRRIRADILPGNASSIAAFREAGYEQQLLQFERDLRRDIDS